MSLERVLAVSSTGGTKQLSDTDTARVGRIGAESAVGPASVVIEVSSGATATLGASALTLSSGIGLVGAGSPTITGFDSATFTTKVVTPEVESTGNMVLDANSGSDSTMTFQNAGAGNLDATFSGNLTVSGDLTVTGTQFITDTTNVQIQDNHLYLNADYETVSAETGGLVVNFLPTATNDTVATGGFTAGVDGASDPTIDTTGAATFSATDFVQVAGAANPENDGLYEVQGHATNVLTLKSTAFGVTNQVEDFTNNQLVTDTTVQGTIRKVNVSVIRAGTDGVWETGAASATPITFADLASANLPLQTAYENGNTITLSDAEGDLVITLDDAGAAADFQVTDSGGDYLVTDATNNSLDLGSAANAVDILAASLVMTGNPIVDGGTGQWDFGGNVDANAGLDVSGGALTINNQAITQSTGGQVDFAGNVDASAGVDIDADNQSLTIGASADLTIVHNATDTIITSTTGDLIIDNTNVTGSTIIRLGTDTSATDFQVQGDGGTARLTVTGASASVTVADGVTLNAFGPVNLGNTTGDAIDVAGTLSVSGLLDVDTWTVESNGATETFAIAFATQTGAGVKGGNFTLTAGTGSGTDGAGGDIGFLTGAGGATNSNSGDLTADVGLEAGAGTPGKIILALTNCDDVEIGGARTGQVEILFTDECDGAGAGALHVHGGLDVEKSLWVVLSLFVDSIDAATATTLDIGSSVATLLTLGAADITTRSLGAFEILGSADTTGAAAFNLAGANATSLNLGASDITITTLGAANFDLGVTMDSTLGITGILTLASTLIGTDDGTGIIVGSVGAMASEGSAFQAQTFTTTQRDFLVGADGMIIYNSTTSRFEGFDDGAFKAFGAGDISEIETDILIINSDAIASDTAEAGIEIDYADGTTLFTGSLTALGGTPECFFLTNRLATEVLGTSSQPTKLVLGPSIDVPMTTTVIDSEHVQRGHVSGAAVGTFIEVSHLLDSSVPEYVMQGNSDTISIRCVIGDNNTTAWLYEDSGGDDWIQINTSTNVMTLGDATSTVTVADVLTVTDVINANGGIVLGDNDTIGYGDLPDAFTSWTGTVLKNVPAVDDTGAFEIGDGTFDWDFKWNSDADSVTFDHGAKEAIFNGIDQHFGDDDILMFGDAAGGDSSVVYNDTLNELQTTHSTAGLLVQETLAAGGGKRVEAGDLGAIATWDEATKAQRAFGTFQFDFLATFLTGIAADDIDTTGANTQVFGGAAATKLEFADTAVISEFQGPVTALEGTTVTGKSDLTGDVDLGTTSGDAITIDGTPTFNVTLQGDATVDIGSAANPFGDIALGGALGVTDNVADATGVAATDVVMYDTTADNTVKKADANSWGGWGGISKAVAAVAVTVRQLLIGITTVTLGVGQTIDRGDRVIPQSSVSGTAGLVESLVSAGPTVGSGDTQVVIGIATQTQVSPGGTFDMQIYGTPIETLLA